ncbi:uncharacterized protein EDB93DRAFT_1255194 [Suillus bovinus]|uniref:uncharacterized protein n=1 Tax=Suillus bovinus TaxID=48563 RepID=UPI001B867BE8|nr:uncharacterized protein EDB93DRAFT_1255194 [Suillus bovinus]KAG2132525.1 hypothetical protein EDB93DRAFT_1255194 [Suillus bovinus]
MARADFVNEYMAAREKVFTTEIISKVWKNSGIRPFNPSIFTDRDFAPSMATSTEASVPASYPIHESDSNSSTDSSTSSDDDESDSTDDESEDEASDSNFPLVNLTGTSFVLPTQHTISTPSLDTPSNSCLQWPLHSCNQRNMSQDSDISILQDQVRELESRVHAAESQVCAAEAHCTMVLSEVDTMKKKLHSRAGKKKTRALNINTCWLTSAQGLKECEEQETAKETAPEEEGGSEGTCSSQEGSVGSMTGSAGH